MTMNELLSIHFERVDGEANLRRAVAAGVTYEARSVFGKWSLTADGEWLGFYPTLVKAWTQMTTHVLMRQAVLESQETGRAVSVGQAEEAA